MTTDGWMERAEKGRRPGLEPTASCRRRRIGNSGGQVVKRLLVLALEVLAEAFLLGTLLGALLFDDFPNTIAAVWALAFAVGVVLYLHGYYLTRAFFGVVWRSWRPWLYPAIAAALFVTHTHIAFIRLKPDMSPLAKAAEVPFLAGGACIVLACAFAGGWLLRRWTQAGGEGPRHHGTASRAGA